MAPLLSVIVPAYGVGEYLPACLDTLRAQTLRDLEIIVVDDGSPDESGEIADDFASRDSRITVLHTENQGLGRARNTGTAAASGRYLVFADSDDLIPPRAYELMVSSLETTGSDIAAGNTWRYIEGKGNVQSWTHQEAFAETRLATHIRKFPTLIRDRMVWNKVYRRSFWDAGGYEFPPIRYEDYPVTLPAHLNAASVDVLSDKVYLWRQRLAEDSITQRSMEVGNLRDRVTSAEMTLDVADIEGGEILARLQGYFTDIDIITLATALAEGEPEDHDETARLAVRLARRLDPAKEWTTPLARRVLHSLKNEDIEGAAALAEWRRGGERAEIARTFLEPRRIVQVPVLVADVAFGGRVIPKLKERKLRNRVMDVARLDDAYVLQVETKLRRLLLERATISAELVADEEHVPLESAVTAFAGQRATVEVKLPDEMLDRLPDEPFELVVRVAVGPMTWSGPVDIARGELPDPIELPGGDWSVLSLWEPGSYGVWARRQPAEAVADVEFTDDALVVRVSPEHGHVAILRPAPSAPLTAAVVDGVATFSLDDVLDDPADDPVSSRAYRDIVAISDTALERLQPSVLPTTRLVGEATGAGGDDVTDDQTGALETDVVPDGVDTERPDAAEARKTTRNLEQLLERTGITPLLLRDYPEEPIDWGDHRVAVRRSPTSSAELSHQRLDHLPRR